MVGIRAISSMLLAIFAVGMPAFGSAPASAPVLPTVNCAQMMSQLNRKIQSDKRYEPVRNALNGDPNQKCQANRAAGHDRNFGLRGQQYRRNTSRECGPEDSSLCLSTYARIRSSLEEYKTKLRRGCEIAGNAAKACTASVGDQARFQCIATELRKAAAAEKEAETAIDQAAKDAAEYHKLSTELGNAYAADRRVMDSFTGQDLTNAKVIRNGQLDTAAPNLLEQLKAAEDRPTITGTGTAGTVMASNGGAQNLDAYYRSADVLARESSYASLAASGYQGFAQEETGLRQQSQRVLLDMAAQNELLATRSVSTPAGGVTRTGGLTGPTNTTSASSLPNPATAMGMMGAGSALANGMNPQASPGAVAQGYPQPTWDPAMNPIQGISGSASAGPSTSSFGGGTKTGTPAELPKGDPKDVAENPSNPMNPGGSFGVASNGDTFVSGNGDLPVETGSASRAPAADSKGKVGGSLAAEAKSGRKKKGEAGADEQATCPPGQQDCAAAVSVGNSAGSKAGGGLGVPVVGASDPALNTVGALDNLFGDLPALDAKGNPTAPVAMGPGGFGFDDGGFGASGETDAGGKQSAPEVAPANSHSLFMRVRVAHEKALKKGSVALFHRKL